MYGFRVLYISTQLQQAVDLIFPFPGNEEKAFKIIIFTFYLLIILIGVRLFAAKD